MTNRVWATEEQAQARVEQLKARGYWPGYTKAEGGWVLLFDPDLGGIR